MAEEKKSIEISYKANINDLKKKLESLPDITKDEARKMVSALDRQLKQAERAAKKSAEASKKAAQSSSRAAKKGAKDFDRLASSAASVAGSFAAMGAGLVMFQQQLADLTNELTDASAKSGLAIETLAGLRLAAEGSGLEFSNLESGLIRFQTSMLDASRGSKSMTDSFEALGVEVKNADGSMRDADSVFNEAIKSLGQMENTTERNALAMKLFGREGGAGLIQSGALDNLESMTALAREFGVSINDDAVNAMGTFQRKMAEFGTVAEGTFQRLLGSLGGDNSVSMGIDAATKAMVYFGSITGDVIGAVSQAFENYFGILQAVGLALTGDFDLAKELMSDLGEETSEAGENLFNMFDRANKELERFDDLSKASLATNNKIADSAAAIASNETKVTDEKKKQLELQKKLKKELEEALEFGDDDIKKLKAKTEHEKQLFELQASEIEKQVIAINDKYDAELAKLEEKALVSGDIDAAQAVADELRKQRQEELNKLTEENAQKTLEHIMETSEQVVGGLGTITGTASDLMKQFAEENKAQSSESFAIQKSLAIASIAMKTAEAIMAAQVLQPPPLNIIAAANAAAIGAAQLAKVQSQQPSFHMGGVAPDEANAKVLKGEAILSRSAVQMLGGEQGIRKIEQGNKQSNETVVIIQPFKHFGRFARELGYQKPKQTGVRGY